MPILLLVTVFVIATCGLVYELVAGALASYLLGDSVTQFSTVIGVYLFAMGVGSYLSQFVKHQVLSVFIRIELLIGLVGGCSAASMFLLFEVVSSFRVLLYGEVLLIGTLVGLEIPLLMRILRDRYTFDELIARVFTFDYIGALLASLLFPLVLVPYLGLMQTGFLFGAINVGVGVGVVLVFWRQLPRPRWLLWLGLVCFAVLLTGLALSERLLDWSERQAYAEPVVLARSTPYQRIVLTQSGARVRLFLNGNLQFSSDDEYRYHEALVHPGLAALPQAQRVLVLGGGDGMAVREVLRYPGVHEVVLVDLDSAMTGLFHHNRLLADLNGGALGSPRVRMVNADAYQWLRTTDARFDFVVCDFPDPSNFSLGKLYSTAFYRQLRRVLAPGGRLVVQSTSPFVAPKSFWCVVATLQSAGLRTLPYHVHVPSFGEWGFVVAGTDSVDLPRQLPDGLRFLSLATLPGYFDFPPDMAPVPVSVNRLNNQALVHYFEREWAAYSR